MIGVFIGRFQPFHIGHYDAINQIIQECDLVKIIIGSSNKSRTKDNPLTFEERKKIIESQKIKNTIIFGLKDIKDDDNWCKNLLKLIGKYDIVYSNNQWVIDILKRNNVQTKKLKLNMKISGSKIREMIAKENKEFVKYCMFDTKKFKKYIDIIKSVYDN